MTLAQIVSQARARAITEAVRAHGGNRSHAAKALGIKREWLHALARRLRLELPPGRRGSIRREFDLAEVRRYAKQGFTLRRSAELLGCHRDTLRRVAREQGITFREVKGGPIYGWQGVRTR